MLEKIFQVFSEEAVNSPVSLFFKIPNKVNRSFILSLSNFFLHFLGIVSCYIHYNIFSGA